MNIGGILKKRVTWNRIWDKDYSYMNFLPLEEKLENSEQCGWRGQDESGGLQCSGCLCCACPSFAHIDARMMIHPFSIIDIKRYLISIWNALPRPNNWRLLHLGQTNFGQLYFDGKSWPKSTKRNSATD